VDIETPNGRYRAVDGFFKRPKKWPFVEVPDVSVDADDNVYVFTRSPHPVMIFDKEGNFLDSWGEMNEQFFQLPHGLSVGPDGFVYTADSHDHSVRKWTKDGKLVLTLGRVHQNAPEFSGTPFNRPTHATVASNGDIYVSDGYGNAHIHRFSSTGELKHSWGGHGHGPGEFNTIHSVFIDHADGDKVYAADRFNNRVQYFTPAGEFLGEWTDLLMPNSVRKGPDGNFYVAELAHRISVLTPEGKVVARWGEDGVDVDDAPIGGAELALPDAPSRNPMVTGRVHHEPGAGLFCAPHGIAVDSTGSFYVAECSESWIGLDRGSRSIQKFIKV
jgi:DNA-binding beta-propeller fold protein YncE